MVSLYRDWRERKRGPLTWPEMLSFGAVVAIVVFLVGQATLSAWAQYGALFFMMVVGMNVLTIRAGKSRSFPTYDGPPGGYDQRKFSLLCIAVFLLALAERIALPLFFESQFDFYPGPWFWFWIVCFPFIALLNRYGHKVPKGYQD